MSNLETIKQEISTIPAEVSITSSADMAESTASLSLANKQVKAIKEEKEKVLAPLREAASAERDRWKPLETKLEGVIKAIRGAMTVYQTEEKKKADAEKAKIAARVGAGKGKLKITTAAKQQAAIDTPDERVETEAGDVAFVTDYEIEIEDWKKVPYEFLKIELRKAEVKKAARAGKEIPGLIIKEVQVPRNYS